jgi:dTDP-glucose pyrophosphorylase
VRRPDHIGADRTQKCANDSTVGHQRANDSRPDEAPRAGHRHRAIKCLFHAGRIRFAGASETLVVCMLLPKVGRVEQTIALVMAGGRGARMRAAGRSVPKPLVPVLGVPLLERSLYPLLRASFSDIVIAVPAATPAITDFARTRCVALALSRGARLSVFEETEPLGNTGCAAVAAPGATTVLVVYADNLTSLNLSAILAHHHASGASLTLATHLEPFQSPYGELTVVDGRVTEYREKPVRHALVCSAVSVLGRDALAELSPLRPMGLSDLCNALIHRGSPVHEFRHEALWIDVNDVAKVADAERLVADNAAAFECWADPPQEVVNAALVADDRRVLLRRTDHDSETNPPGWTLPTLDVPGELELSATTAQPFAEFDDLSADCTGVSRYRVTRCRPPGNGAPLPHELAWVPLGETDGGHNIASAVTRALAASRASPPVAG